MLKYARSLLDTVLGRKRNLDEDTDTTQSNTVEGANKKSKVDDNSTIIYKVFIKNIASCPSSTLKEFMASKGIPRFNKSPKWDYAIATYQGRYLETSMDMVTEEEHRNRFLSKANKKKKGKKNTEQDVNPNLSPAERLAKQVTPLYQLPYEEQLKKKQSIGEQHLYKLKKELIWLQPSKAGLKQIKWVEGPGLPCEVLDIIASPETEGYRTKCEFTIGKDLDGKPTVGFLLGLFRLGIVAVLEPSELKNIPNSAKKIAKAMQDYVRTSEYPVYDREEKEGVWRTLMTKTQRTGDVMILVQIKSQGLGEEKVAEIKKDLVDFWTLRVKDQGIDVTTLLFQEWDGASNGLTDRAPTQVLYGEGYIYEELLGCRFRISSSAFFQVNTPGAELMLSKCAEWCNLNDGRKTTLLDICCGTGTIGITMAKSVDKVIGVEMVPEAIVDAKANAERNGITNVTYYASKVENQLNVFRRQDNEEIVAVLDPPSCDAKQAIPNFVTLCRPKTQRIKGLPFKPVRAVSVDLFPHSEPSELMIEFARIKPDE
ncbi:S-adenosyl-L-methionine-dependent methyltransferase [Chlamydoabsidia padenii]|nr:S-adenosyl-L-methionine-dependent methyltransferase [Chlamydoabsidia padenii]